MRPERLALSAFGPFAGEQGFDFTVLGAHRLFLIHGPTGAGKTTLLDALCFALFGASSGAERQPANLRSHHAAATTPTRVELDFRLGPDRYRIRRSPAQPQPGRGGRLVTVPPKVTLWRREAEGLVVLADQERRAREEIERLLGYTLDEFRQVVVLPQDRFREVLTATPAARQAILATLFRTGLYRRIEEKLAARAKLALDDAKQVEEHRRTLLAEAGAATPEEAAALTAGLAERRDAAEGHLAPLRKQAEQEAANLVHGRQTARLLHQAAETAWVLESLQAREPEVAADRDRLAAARRAAGTLPADLLHVQAQAEAGRARLDAKTAAMEAHKAERRVEDATARLCDEAARVHAIEAGRAEAARLDSSARAALAAEDAEARAADLRRRVEAARADHAEAEARLASARTRWDHATRTHEEASWTARMAEWLRAVAGDTKKAAELTARVGTLTRARDSARRVLDSAAITLRQAIAARDAAEAAWRAHHAADLARHLTDGTPCPVCGSLDHPAPFLTGTDLADRDPAVEAETAARTRHAAAEDTARKVESDLERTQDQLDLLRARLPDGLDSAEAARAATAATEAEGRLPALAEAVTLATTDREAAEGAVAATREAALNCERMLDGLRGEIGARRADAPADAGTSTVLRQSAASLAARVRTEAITLDADRTEQAAAHAALIAARDRATRDTERACEAEGKATVALAEWQLACRAAGFAEAGMARSARLPPERVAELEASLRSFDDQLSATKALAEQARDAAAGLTTPDLPALEEADRIARLAAEAAAAEAATLRERHQRAAQLLAAITEAEAALTTARERHTLLRDMASATTGANDKNLSLMGFVLTSILDEALAAANGHLALMLGGRYRVRRREEPSRANAKAGLDIEVLDEWTGMERPAGTLSGGEGFCAALALALGLADTVQAHAGARRIDMLFIDEGFGALDEDALDTAMDVLDRLQAGDRLVGIISHVAELRARIPAQLVIRPGSRGSSAAFWGSER